MIQQIRAYVGELFANVPASKRANDLREEICSNLIDKFVDLTGQGMTEEDAYTASLASIGNIDEMLEALKAPAVLEDPAARKRSALLTSIAVALYIASFIPVSIFGMAGNEWGIMLGVVAMFGCWAVATGLLIYNHMVKPKYTRMDDTMVEEFKEWQNTKTRKGNGLFGAVSAALWTSVVAVYLIISFVTWQWPITWIIFPITVAVQMIIRAFIVYNRDR